jgi:hypothetical protein
VENIRARHGGGPAPEEVRSMITDRHKRIRDRESEYVERMARLAAAYKMLDEAERQALE